MKLSKLLFDYDDDIIMNIIRHLNHIFEARKGMTPCAPDFGLDDYSDSQQIDYSSALCKALHQAIVSSEPRLSQVSVATSEPPMNGNLAFKIRASLKQGGHIQLAGKMLPQGVIHVTSA